MLESFQNLGRLISKFKETNLAEPSRIVNKLGLFCLFSPFLGLWDFSSFFHSCVVLCSATGLLYMVCSPGCTHYLYVLVHSLPRICLAWLYRSTLIPSDQSSALPGQN